MCGGGGMELGGLPLNSCILTTLGTGLLDVSCVGPVCWYRWYPRNHGRWDFCVSCIECSETTSSSLGFRAETLGFTPPAMGKAFYILDCREQHVNKNVPCDKTDNIPHFDALVIRFLNSLLDMGAGGSYWNAIAPAVDL